MESTVATNINKLENGLMIKLITRVNIIFYSVKKISREKIATEFNIFNDVVRLLWPFFS